MLELNLKKKKTRQRCSQNESYKQWFLVKFEYGLNLTSRIFSVKVIRECNSKIIQIILMRCFWKKSGKTFFLIHVCQTRILDYIDFMDNKNNANAYLIHTFFPTICTHIIPWSSNQFLKKLLVFRHLVELPSVATIFSSEIYLVTSF